MGCDGDVKNYESSLTRISFLMANFEENRQDDVMNLSTPDIKLRTWFPDYEVDVLV